MLRILCAIDGGIPAGEAVSLLDSCVRRDAVEVSVLSVAGASAPEEEVHEAGEIAIAAAGLLVAAGIRAEGRPARGPVAATIVEEAREGRFDLILMGAGNKRWVDRLLLGSQSTRVLHTAPCSVMVVHEAPPAERPVNVLVGVDGSPDAEFALDLLIALADPARCVTKVLSVAQVPYPTFAGGPGTAYATTAFTEEIEAELTASARGHAEGAAGRLKDAGFRSDARWTLGSAAIRLLEESEGGSSDLIVVGARGLGPIDRMVMGSVSDKMTRHARAALVGRRRPG